MAAASPVFETMFCGSLKEDVYSNVEIPDIQPNIFRNLMQYIYTDEVKISGGSAVQLIYAAKKYIIPELEKKCQSFLENNLTKKNVCSVLSKSIPYAMGSLEKRCLEFIKNNTDTTLAADEFVRLSQEALVKVLSLEELNLQSELALYKAAVTWGRNRGAGTDAEIRELLGPALFLLRLPSVDAKEFSDVCCGENILTDSEKIHLIHYILSTRGTLGHDEKKGKYVDCFPVEGRLKKVQEYIVERFTNIESGSIWHCRGSVDAICLTASTDINLRGVGICRTVDGYPIESVKLDVIDENGKIMKTVTENNKSCLPDSEVIPILLSENVKLLAGKTYDISVLIKSPSHYTYCGTNGNTDMKIEGRSGPVSLKFSDSDRSTNGTKVGVGQIPQILYSI